MKHLTHYILENISDDAVRKIIDTFFDNLDALSIIRKQHFLTRLSLCDIPEAKDLHLDTGIDDVVKVTKEVVEMIKDKDYKKLMDKYIIIPYKGINKNKDITYKWLSSFKDEKTLRYFAIGYLSEKLDIIERTDSVDKVDFWDDIYKIYEDIDELVKFHNEDSIDCKHKCGTLYVNWIGNAYYVLSSDKLEFDKKIDIDDWRKTRKHFVNMKEYNNISVYGVTHSIINGTRYYIKSLDVNEFADEIEYIKKFLEYEREQHYKLEDLVTIDLLCECALCLKLTKSDKYDEWKHVRDFMVGQIDKKTNILQSNSRSKKDKKENIEKNEHCNVLFILLNKIKL
jgi:hypothetical protein